MPYNILVVDDEPDLELLITQKFRKRIRTEELSFCFAANGADALEKLASTAHLIDVVLTDINMPVMDGLTLLLKLREAHPLLRSVIVSAYGDMANIRTALNRGAFDFVTKPIDFQDLEITLDKAIGEAILSKEAAKNRDRMLGLNRELDLARSIQESLVPRDFPRDRRCEVFGSMTPATHVGGDLFDVFPLDEHRMAFTIGDVSGKGIGAALYMAVCRTVLRVTAGKGLSPRECLAEVNRFLCHEKQASSVFVTCFYAILDLQTGELEYSRGGHNPPYRLHGGNEFQTLDAASGLPVGLLGFAEYDSAVVRMEPGDSVVLFTDGVTEAENPLQDQYSEERLVPLLQQMQSSNLSIKEMMHGVSAAVKTFADGAPASDDLTLLGFRYLGN